MCDSNSLLVCRKCGEAKPATTEFFARNKGTKTGLATWCKICRNVHAKARNAPQKKRPDAPEGFKYCSSCKEFKPATAEVFGHRKLTKDGLHHYCKPCTSARQRAAYPTEVRTARTLASRTKNQDAYNEKRNEWRRENPEKARAQEKRYRQRHPEAYYAKQKASHHRQRARQPERFRERARLYRENNRELFRHYAAKRRELIKTGQVLTQPQLRQIVEGQDGLCWWCAKPCGEKYHLDHVMPLSKGGNHALSNLRATCVSCNTRKNALMPWDFAGRLL